MTLITNFFALIEENWDKRVIGRGADSVDDVCLVPLPPEKFVCTTILVEDAEEVYARITKRQPNEHLFIKTEADGPTVTCQHAKVVLYAAHELLKNGGERSCDADWEIVCVLASDTDDEPMHPLAMARNQLEMPGGTPRKYSSEEWANAVWYWSQRCKRKADD